MEKPRVVIVGAGVAGYHAIYAWGDDAAVPDLTRPGEVAAMTAQHAERQRRRVAVTARQTTQLGLVPAGQVPLETAVPEHLRPTSTT
jgi:NADH dehydrogenase FAD-containing subunit